MTGTRRTVAPWLWYLVLGLIATALVSGVHRPWATWSATILQASAAVALGYGAWRFRPARPLFWWLLAAGQLAYAAAQGYWRIRFDGERGLIPFGDVNDVLYIGSLLLFSAALAVGPRPRKRAASGIIDSAAVVLGLAFGTWNLIAEPYVTSGLLDDRGIAVFLTYEALEVLRMALLVRILLAGRPAGGVALLAAGMLTQLAGDLVYGIRLLSPVSAMDAWQNAAWIAGSVLIGAAGLYPKTAPAAPAAEPEESISRLRLVTFLLLILIYPVTTVLQILMGRDRLPDLTSFVTTVLPSLLVAAVAVLLIVRLGLLAGVAERRAAEMRRALTAEHLLRVELGHQATHDPLTGLANRTVLTEALARTDGHGALLLIDLESFKQVNDRYGQHVGDRTLTEVGRRITAEVPDGVVARLGSDEFAVLSPVRTEIEALALAGRIGAALDLPCPVTGMELVPGHRTGVALLAPGARTDAMHDADLALNAAKDPDGERVVLFHAGLRDAWRRQSEIGKGLRRALSDGSLALHYQPIVDLRTGAVTAVEALARWRPEGGAPVSPGEFIPVAERSELISELGSWALRTACADTAAWRVRHDISVTVNVSARQLADPRFRDEVLSLLATYALPGEALVLEITESMLLGSAGAMPAAVTATLDAVRAHGVRIAVDDFGTGYSSLAYLHELPVDILKLDRSLTLGHEPTVQKTAVARAAIDLGNALGMQTVAEGVESAGQAELLLALGCLRAQGFHFARPMPAAELTVLLAARRLQPAAG